MKKIFLLSLGISFLFTSCKKDELPAQNNIFKGPVVQVHEGKAWTWVQLDRSGKPERLAITLTDAALNSVPVGHNGDGHDHSGDNIWTLPFHPKAAITPFNHVGMGWNPDGHEPEPIYGKPHFDFHFSMMSPYEVDSLKFKNWPAQAYFPPTYFNPGGGVPQMGTHWVDATSGEFNGKPFTQTFIFGSYDGKVTFYEPMITLDFLKNNSNFGRNIPQPAKFQKTGYYPTKMKLIKHDGVTEIILDGFVFKTQS
jgi:Domain of unknown function (DUF5602)